MDKNYEMDLNRWVDEKLATLGATDKWQPDTERALARFKELHARKGGRLMLWRWAAAPLLALCLCLAVLPRPRSFALHVWEELTSGNVNRPPVSAAVKTLIDGQLAPDFHLKDAWGQEVQVSALKGKVVLLNFWATWCEGCQEEIPAFIDFQEKYRNRGFAMVGISMDADGWAVVKPYLEASKINYSIVIGNDDVAKRYGVGSMPMTYLIDRNGKIAATYVGLVDKNNCENVINRLLGE
jgi:cytochrome c biogenesis protein CcmG/thiol:disulfide interchange protein DsbE